MEKEGKKEKKTSSNKSNPYNSLSLDELNKILDEAISKEDYEKASEIRDEIKKRDKS